jgi:hypothetical protein
LLCHNHAAPAFAAQSGRLILLSCHFLSHLARKPRRKALDLRI